MGSDDLGLNDTVFCDQGQGSILMQRNLWLAPSSKSMMQEEIPKPFIAQDLAHILVFLSDKRSKL